MDFRFKCLLQTVFGILPSSESLNYYAQKYLSKSLPPSRELYEQIYATTLLHRSAFEKFGNKTSPVVYEIGCGWHLGMALILSSLGYRDIIALDTVCHARLELIDKIVGYIQEDNLLPSEVMARHDGSYDIKKRLIDDFGITYLAPADSACTGFKDKSIDYIYSHTVLEHIPPSELPAILKECHRVLDEDGVMSFSIDYSDHYCIFDKSITPYNFLKYSDKAWRKYNPRLQYVNRLRHCDIVGLFKQAGFAVVYETIIKPENADCTVSVFPFSDEFASKYSAEDLSITGAYIALKKR